MDLFHVLSLIGGLCLFLFGMSLMGTGLEKAAGSSLKTLLGKLTTNKTAGFLTGLGVTAVMQSSSATTVMVVGFVNSGIMTLKQAINVIMGANVGTTVTAWILSLSGIESSNMVVRLLKPTSFTPLLALVGIAFYMLSKSSKKKDTGLILLGFTILMFGMETMTGAVSGLKDVPEFRNILLMFSNPILGVLAGAVFTGIIQSSSAAVGILQALATTGQVTFGTAIPIILGQNIGTCVTAMISSVGTNKNARRAAVVHLSFNVIGTIIWLSIFSAANAVFHFNFISHSLNQMDIAIIHSLFNVLCTLLLLPLSSLLEKLSYKFIPDAKTMDSISELDERLMATPSIAIDRCRVVTETMAAISGQALKDSLSVLNKYDPTLAANVREHEEATDHYEDILGNYIVRLSSHAMSDADSIESAKLLRLIGDLERISDHAVNVVESAEEIRNKNILFSADAQNELSRITDAVQEILDLAISSFVRNDVQSAALVFPLEEVVDALKEQLRSNHILRLQKGECSIEAGFVWSDLLTNLERVADHCSNIANCVVQTSK
ncbi:MAG TPA: Na/Pi cotransporter, partial [Clostridiales bacterium]|nr:Na/Pi cotransporter [Clostridiales bacterium]